MQNLCQLFIYPVSQLQYLYILISIGVFLSLNDIMLMLMYDSVFRYDLHIFDEILPQISIQNISCPIL